MSPAMALLVGVALGAIWGAVNGYHIGKTEGIAEAERRAAERQRKVMDKLGSYTSPLHAAWHADDGGWLHVYAATDETRAETRARRDTP